MNYDDLPNLTGKTVSFSLQLDEYLAVIENPRFEVQGGRLFVRGITPKGASGGDWLEGVDCAVAWDSVTRYHVFSSSEDYFLHQEKAFDERV